SVHRARGGIRGSPRGQERYPLPPTLALVGVCRAGTPASGRPGGMLQLMVDDWWKARSRGEALMQASAWRDVPELNSQARSRLVEAGIVEPNGLDVRGETVGVGDQVLVLRNDRHLGVINGTMGTVTAIDRD